jgi:hypothetical protein
VVLFLLSLPELRDRVDAGGPAGLLVLAACLNTGSFLEAKERTSRCTLLLEDI